MELFIDFSSTGFIYKHVCVPGQLNGYQIYIYWHCNAGILVHSTHKQGSNQQLDFLKLIFSMVSDCFILAGFADFRNKISVYRIHPSSGVLRALQFWLGRRMLHNFQNISLKP